MPAYNVYLKDTTQHMLAHTGTVILASTMSPKSIEFLVYKGRDGTQASGTCRPSRRLTEPGKDTTKS